MEREIFNIPAAQVVAWQEPLPPAGHASQDAAVPFGNSLPRILGDKATQYQADRKASINRAPHCLIVANWVATKGILEFFDALANAKWRGSDRLRITLAGSDNIEPNYAGQCKRLWNNDLWLKKILRYAGALPQRELAKLYRSADLFLSSSFFETYGMALHEARFFGLPILAMRGGNVAFHVHENQGGRLFSRMEDLVETLGELIENERLLIEFQIAAWQARPVENYTWQDAADIFRGFQGFKVSGFNSHP